MLKGAVRLEERHLPEKVYGWLATSSDLHKLKKFPCLRDVKWECKPEEEMAKIKSEAFPEVKKPSSYAAAEGPSEEAWAEAEDQSRGANGLTETESTKGE
ncbi:hypothetical protein CYMTET_7848 [Cymbomonas tetramitiformis]|uniref:Uncharacterized protein n=1 Tax=Cymbomonas tetramitiformis TaxID=36881 RepID=A0AAE0LGN7_9CHLO|nr:hypothetical protein CYMTET_7848 [Cymbomonas tetramitiformis]